MVSDKHLISALKVKNTIAECDVNQVHQTTTLIADKFNGIKSYSELSEGDRWSIHTAILCTDNFFSQVEKAVDKDKSDYVANQRKTLVNTSEYIPYWVIVAVALAISIGTMIGYKRIVHTIGEKIGNSRLTICKAQWHKPSQW